MIFLIALAVIAAVYIYRTKRIDEFVVLLGLLAMKAVVPGM